MSRPHSFRRCINQLATKSHQAGDPDFFLPRRDDGTEPELVRLRFIVISIAKLAIVAFVVLVNFGRNDIEVIERKAALDEEEPHEYVVQQEAEHVHKSRTGCTNEGSHGQCDCGTSLLVQFGTGTG